MKNISNRLPSGLSRYGYELHEIDQDTRVKYIISHPTTKYRAFMYRNKNEELSNSSISDLCEACVYESGLGSSLILSGKAI
jgi:hypothetical protein